MGRSGADRSEDPELLQVVGRDEAHASAAPVGLEPLDRELKVLHPHPAGMELVVLGQLLVERIVRQVEDIPGQRLAQTEQHLPRPGRQPEC